MAEQTRIGILGGTFDPVHNGHLMIAQQARQAAGLHRVVLMPAGTPPHKSGAMTPAHHRLAMTALAAQECGFEVSDFEIRSPGVDYTADTLEALGPEYPGAMLYFIIGGDSLMMLDQWRFPERFFKLAVFVAVYRPGFRPEELEQKRAELTARFGGQILLVPCPGLDVSSTAVRAMAAAGQDLAGLVPAPVARYISEHQLYR